MEKRNLDEMLTELSDNIRFLRTEVERLKGELEKQAELREEYYRPISAAAVAGICQGDFLYG